MLKVYPFALKLLFLCILHKTSDTLMLDQIFGVALLILALLLLHPDSRVILMYIVHNFIFIINYIVIQNH